MKTIFFLLFFYLFFFGTSYATDQLVINEIMYNSDGDDVEYVELVNISGENLNVNGWYILDNNDTHDPCVLEGDIEPGGYLVVAGDWTLFSDQYSGVSNVNSNFFDTDGAGWALGNGGDAVRLFDASDNLHDEVVYSDGGDWPGSADGGGPSLELFYPFLDNALATSWNPSLVDWGTPGEQNSIYTLNVVPTCKNGSRDIDLPSSSNNVTVTVIAFDSEDLNSVELFVDTGNGFAARPMADDGLNGDDAAGDSVYTAIISTQPGGTLVRYYAMATDGIGQTDTWPNDAPDDYHAYTVDFTPPALRITEVLALNESGIQDNYGENDDWFEIVNGEDGPVDLEGMFVSDLLNSSRTFELPAVTLQPGEYLLVWADNDTEQGPLHVHANFRLTSEGESIALFETVDHGNVLIHGWKFGRMSADVSMGFPDGESTAPEYLAEPTPGTSNASSPLFSDVCINEFQSTSDFGGPDDWVEIYNRGSESFDLSGCFLSDQRGDNTKWTFPEGTSLDPGEYLVIYEDALEFGFSSDGDDVIMLTAADTVTGLDFYDFGPQIPDHSEGRSPDGGSVWGLLTEPTIGSPNSSITTVDDPSAATPQTFALHQNYPNPFNPETHISFVLQETNKTTVRIFNMLGREIVTILDRNLTAGVHQVKWNSADSSGRPVGSGVYFYRIESGNFSATRKMILIR